MPNKKTYNYNAGKPGKFPDLSGDGKITKKDILMGRGVIKSGGGPNKVGSKEKYTEGNFAEMHHMKMMGSPLYYGESKPAMAGGNYTSTNTNQEVFSEKKEEKKEEEGSKKSEGTKRLSAAKSRRREARKNLKAQRQERRATRMEERLARRGG